MLSNFRANALDLARLAVDEILIHIFPGAAAVTDQTTRLCVAPGRPHSATDGLLCRDHLEELGTWLRDIQEEVERLSAVPPMSSRLGQGGGGSLASQQAPVVLDAIVYLDQRTTAQGWRHVGPICPRCDHGSCKSIQADRDERGGERLKSVFNVLHGWAQEVRDDPERMLGVPVEKILVRVPPGHEGPFVVDSAGTVGATTLVPARLTIASERNLLTRHLDWIAGRPWVLDMRIELAELRTQLRRHNRNEEDRPLTGYCYRLVDDKGTQCGGPLWPVYAHTSDSDDTTAQHPREVVCGKNPAHRWKGGKGGDLARLSLILEQQRREDAAHSTPVPTPATPRPPRRDAGAGDRLTPLLAEQSTREDDAS